MARYICANGGETEVVRELTLERMQEYVKGFIEIVPCYNPKYKGYHIILNEEGKLMGLPINRKATEIYGNPNDLIVGDVLLVKIIDAGLETERYE